MKHLNQLIEEFLAGPGSIEELLQELVGHVEARLASRTGEDATSPAPGDRPRGCPRGDERSG